jgi:hypothetical protein
MRFIRIGVFVVLLAGLPLLFLAGRHSKDAEDDGRECRSLNKFAEIELVLLNYHRQHGAFPPTKYRAKPCGPLHSWRVLLLPYSDPADPYIKEHYAKYDFSQEWNSPTNLQALGGMPEYNDYRLRNYDRKYDEVANYLAIGEGDEWPVERPLRSYLVTEGNDRFLLFEYPDSKIKWMEPKY